jgi:hypothetical protein
MDRLIEEHLRAEDSGGLVSRENVWMDTASVLAELAARVAVAAR